MAGHGGPAFVLRQAWLTAKRDPNGGSFSAEVCAVAPDGGKLGGGLLRAFSRLEKKVGAAAFVSGREMFLGFVSDAIGIREIEKHDDDEERDKEEHLAKVD